MAQERCFRVLALLVFLWLQGAEARVAATPASAPAISSQEPLVSLSKVQAKSFTDALDALAVQGHTAIIAEGAPLKQHLREKDTPDLTVAVPLSQAVTRMATAFDYDVQRQSHVFVLVKRYTDPKDLPCVTLEECQEAFGDILSLLNQFNPQFDERNENNNKRIALTNFFRSLSPAQAQAAQNKTLHYGELDPAQQEMAERLFLSIFVQFSANRVQDSVDALNYAPRSFLTGQDGDYTGVLIQSPVPGNKIAVSLRPIDFAGRATSTEQLPPQLIPPELTVIGTLSTPKTMTLEDLVGFLGHTNPPPVVDIALKDKPISAVGLNYASSLDVLRAVTVLYGLHLGASDAGGPRLMRPLFTDDASLQNLSRDMWELVPLPMRRALHQEEAFSVVSSHERSSAGVNIFQQEKGTENLIKPIWSEAVHQVLLGLQPQLRSQGLRAHIPVKVLDKATRRALAIALSIGTLEQLQDGFTGRRTQEVLDCLQNIDNTVVYTVLAEANNVHGTVVPTIHFEGTDPYTNKRISLGSTGVFVVPAAKR